MIPLIRCGTSPERGSLALHSVRVRIAGRVASDGVAAWARAAKESTAPASIAAHTVLERPTAATRSSASFLLRVVHAALEPGTSAPADNSTGILRVGIRNPSPPASRNRLRATAGRWPVDDAVGTRSEIRIGCAAGVDYIAPFDPVIPAFGDVAAREATQDCEPAAVLSHLHKGF